MRSARGSRRSPPRSPTCDPQRACAGSRRIRPVGDRDLMRRWDAGPGVVVQLGVAEPHRVWWWLHPGEEWREQLLLRVDQILPADIGELVLVAHRQRARPAGLDAESAENAAQIVDLVDPAVALTRRVAL